MEFGFYKDLQEFVFPRFFFLSFFFKVRLKSYIYVGCESEIYVHK